MTLQEIKEQVNLIKYARDYHGLECNRDGKAHCPFHKPDKNPSFVINFDGGIWKWFDHHDQQGGSIVDFEMRFANCSKEEAIKTLLSRYGDQAIESEKSAATIIETISYVYKDADGKEVLKKEKKTFSDGKKTYTWRHKENNNWLIGKGNQRLIPYNLDKFKNHKKAVVCEGEKDCDNVNSLGIFSTTAPAGAQSWQDSLSQYFSGFDKIVFMYDVGAENWAKKHASSLKRTYLDKKILIASVPMETKDSDITDYMNQFKTKDEAKEALLELLQTAEELTEPEEEDLELTEPKIELIEDVTWLWDWRIPEGCITLLAGKAGQGKSLICHDLSAKISAGKELPFSNSTIEGKVVILSSEERVNNIISPRLYVAGAYFPNIRIYSVLDRGTKSLIKEENIKWLYTVARNLKNIKLLVIDTIIEFSGVDVNKTENVYEYLLKLSEFSNKTRIPILGCTHLAKDPNLQDPLYKILGSVKWSAIPRSAFILKQEEEIYYLAPCKSSLCKMSSTLSFEIEEIKYKNTGFPKIKNWHESRKKAEELTSTENDKEEATKVLEAERMIKKLLKLGEMESNKLKKELVPAICSERTYYTAKTKCTDAYRKEEKWWTFLSK